MEDLFKIIGNPGSLSRGLEYFKTILVDIDNSLGFCRRKIINIAGTNGKGTTAAYIEAISIEAKIKTGLFTSPHLLNITERLRINGVEIDNNGLLDIATKIMTISKNPKLSFFEWMTAIAYYCFTKHRLELWIMEIGVGARLDPVNTIDPDISIITSISMDHEDLLGSTLDKIAIEKFAVARANKPLILFGKYKNLAPEAISYIPGEQFGYYTIYNEFGSNWCYWNNLEFNRRMQLPALQMRGEWNMLNASMAITAVDILYKDLAISSSDIRMGLLRVKLRAKFELINCDNYSNNRKIILDSAHNKEAAQKLLSNLKTLPPTGINTFILGMHKNKSLGDFFDVFKDYGGKWIFTCLADIYRPAYTKESYRDFINTRDIDAFVTDSVYEAYKLAIDNSGNKGHLIITGSHSTLAELLKLDLF